MGHDVSRPIGYTDHGALLACLVWHQAADAPGLPVLPPTSCDIAAPTRQERRRARRWTRQVQVRSGVEAVEDASGVHVASRRLSVLTPRVVIPAFYVKRSLDPLPVGVELPMDPPLQQEQREQQEQRQRAKRETQRAQGITCRRERRLMARARRAERLQRSLERRQDGLGGEAEDVEEGFQWGGACWAEVFKAW